MTQTPNSNDKPRMARVSAVIALSMITLSGCSAMDRLANIGQAPEMTKIANPTDQAGYQPVSMPMPAPRVATRQANSLWQEGSRAFFKDQRASEVGDIITVVVEINDTADVSNTTTRSRATSDAANLAGVITQKLPNGNLVLFGRQEVRVNFEVREIVVGGVIRPQDIASTNTINYDQMAEARISYGGRGQLTDVQQPRYGSQVLDVIMPF